MDGVSLVAGIPGLVQSCVHGYRFVCTMIDMDKAAHVMRLKYRIEECRLVLWGQFWGLLELGDGLKTQSSPQSLDDLLRIRGVESLINDILGKVLASLQEVRKMSGKYNTVPSESSGESHEKLVESSPVSWRRRVTTKVRWALKDKTDFEEVLSNLKSLNDGLHELLPRQERKMLGQALVGEVMAEEGIDPTGKDAKLLSSAFEGKTPGFEPVAESKGVQKAQPIEDAETAQPSPLSDPEIDRDRLGEPASEPESDRFPESSPGDSSMELPLEWFLSLTAKIEGVSVESLRRPVDFDSVTQTETSAQPNEDIVESQAPKYIEEEVFIEWRNYRYSVANEELQMALDARREQISRRFRGSSKESDHIVMQCLGYILVDGDCMGLVFRPPPGSAGPPVSLHAVLRDGFDSGVSHVPDLDDRIMLAKKLCITLYQLQCSGWLHRKISSHNIVFFPHSMEDGARGFTLAQPRLVGWQTARVDDQSLLQPTEAAATGPSNRWLPEELPYIHPARATSRIRFRRSFDVYSLGIVLAEIAFWEPIDVLSGTGDMTFFSGIHQSSGAPGLQRFSMLVLSTCKEELAGEVGREYMSAVVWALEGVQSWNTQRIALQTMASNEELAKEIGLEKAFFWHVVSRMNALTDDDDHDYSSVCLVRDHR